MTEKQNEIKKKTHRTRKARLIIDCSSEQKKKIKMMAAVQEMSITDFILKLFEEKYSWCPLELSHVPNTKTIDSIASSEKGKGIKTFDSMDDLFKDLSI